MIGWEDLSDADRAALARLHMGTRDPDPRVEESLRAHVETLAAQVADQPPQTAEELREVLKAERAALLHTQIEGQS